MTRKERLVLGLMAALSPLPALAEQHWFGKEGSCKAFVVAGQQARCGGISVTSEADNGRVLTQFTFGKDNLLMFSGNPDTMEGLPVIVVDTVKVGTDPTRGRTPAEGSCVIGVTSRQVVISCDVMDRNGKHYLVKYKGKPG